MLLQSHRSHDTLGHYDPNTGTLKTISRGKLQEQDLNNVRGTFDSLDGKQVLLYRAGESLILDVGRRQLPMKKCQFDMHVKAGLRELRVLYENQLAVELKYELPKIEPPIADDLAGFSEEEDFDFGLFLYNVSEDPERQSRMYGG